MSINPVARMVIKPSIFERAANRIEENGWHRGYYYPDHDEGHSGMLEVGEQIRLHGHPCCVLGSIYAEVETVEAAIRYTDFLANVLGLGEAADLVDWNDKPTQRKARVIAALRRAQAAASKEMSRISEEMSR